MQSQLDNGKILYAEYADSSGFIVREIYGTRHEWLRYQAGRYETRPMNIPIYNAAGKLQHHVQGDDIQVFAMHGHGPTKGEALFHASNKLLRADIKRGKLSTVE